MPTFYMAPFPFSSLHVGPQIAAHAAGCFSELFDNKSKHQSTSLRMGLFWLLSICIFITHLCYDSALVNKNGCKVKLGTQGMSP